ncbi:MAG TPA: YafY family protein [Solirubrobacterales bacterium]|jgi:predicted DNA-binding transcriptional regulator YafY|nr:YafY family protein [Solirubrobacterales bacterium]
MNETSSRLLTLLSLLQARRDWAGGELAERLEVSRRTVRRDVERLRQLGYPIESLAGPAGGYRLEAGTAMPPLLLDDDEAIAIAVGLRTAAGASVSGIEEASLRALVKLEQVLPSRLRPRLRALQAAETTFAIKGPTVDPQCLTAVGSACRESERLRFAYRDREGNETRREVDPHTLVSTGRRWYLVAWDRGREDWRSFRVDRIARPATTGVRATERELPTKDAAAYVTQSISAMPTRYEARVVLKAPAAEVRGHFSAGWGRLEEIDERSCEFRTGDDDLDWLALRVAMLGVEFEVREPPELAEHLASLAGRVARGAGAPMNSTAPVGLRS